MKWAASISWHTVMLTSTLSVLALIIVLSLLSSSKVFGLRVMQRIAVIGGGYAGLGVGTHLSKIAKSIHVYDNFPPGLADASATSAGIMHPMATRGKIIWKGQEGMKQALELMQSVQSSDGGRIYDDNVQLNRLLFTKEEVNLWADAVVRNPEELELIAVADVQSEQSQALGAVRIKRAVVVDSQEYLKALWTRIVQNCPDAEWKQQKVQSVVDLSQQYDAVILACGGGIVNLCSPLGLPTNNKISKIRLVRGQNAVYESESESEYIDDCKIGNGYLSGEYCIPYTPRNAVNTDTSTSGNSTTNIVTPVNKVYMLGGSTHEHITAQQYETLTTGDKSPDLSVLQAQIENRLLRIHPALRHYTPVHTVAGTKVVTNRDALGRLPIVGKLHVQEGPGSRALDNVWVHAGFGSRGLILHALTSKYLCDAIVHDDESLIPDCLHMMVK